jgi:PAS domain S-box-containing protein
VVSERTRSENERLRVRAVGDVAEAAASLRDAGDVTLAAGSDRIACVLCTPADVGAAVAAGRDVPVLAVDDGDPVATLADGATAVASRDADLAARIRWLTGRSPATASRGDLAAAFDAAGDDYLVLDRELRVVRLSGATDALGLRAPVAGRRLWPALADPSRLRRLCWTAVEAGEARSGRVSECDRWASVDAVPAADGMVVRVADVTDRVATGRALERYERVMETIDDGVYVLDGEFRIQQVNEAVCGMTGYEREQLIGAHASILADASVIREAAAVIQEILAGERRTGRLVAELETASGSPLAVETRFSAFEFPDGTRGSVGVIRDVTDRRRFEATLTELHRSTRRLFGAETTGAVGEVVVSAAAAVPGLGGVSLYRLDEDRGALVAVATSGSATGASVAPGDGGLWDAYAGDETATVVRGDATVRAVPLGAHGLLAGRLAADAGEETAALTDLLAANAEAALDRVARERKLARRERELAAHNETLERLNRFNRLIREVNAALVEADSRGEIEHAVTDRLVDSSFFEFAWIGEFDRAAGTLTPRAWAGRESGYLDEFAGTVDAPAEPSVRAARTGEPVVVDGVAEGVQRHSWRRRALSRGFHSLASVPLVYDGHVYGTVAVYAGEPDVVDEATLATLAELGQTTADAINSAQAREALQTESVVELDLAVSATNAPLRRIAAATDAAVTLDGHVPRGDGRTLLYVSVAGDPGAVADVTAVDRAAVVERRGEVAAVEAVVTDRTVPSVVTDHGGVVGAATATAESVSVTVELTRGVDVRGFVETVSGPFPGTELLARRTDRRPVESRRALESRIESDLTDRQLEAIRAAYRAGYYEWPRDRSGEEVAATLGVTGPTFSRHLRVAQRKILEVLFDGGAPNS